MKKTLSLTLSLLLTLVFTACGGDSPSPASAAAGGTPAAIVSMAPATTQVLLDLGLKESIVAVDTDSAWMFPEVADLPAFDLMGPDVEALLALEPELVFTSILSTGGSDDPFSPLYGNEDIRVEMLETPSTIEGIWNDVLLIGRAVNKESEAQVLVDDAKAIIEEVSGASAGIGEKRTVLFEISALPYIYSFGEGVYLNEALLLIGAENVLSGQEGWLPVTEEAAVDATPDVILTNVNYLDDAVEEIMTRDGWQSVTAVESGDVYYIDNAASSLPNHHVAQAVVAMAKAVYPEVYSGL